MNTIPQTLDERVIRSSVVTNVLLVVAGSALIAIAAQIAINVPFSPVPLTMQPIAVLLVGVVLGSKRGAAAATLYLLEGMSGMPVFAQMHGGAAWLLGRIRSPRSSPAGSRKRTGAARSCALSPGCSWPWA